MAATAQRAIVPLRLPCQLDTACLEYFQLEQLPLDISCDRLITNALKGFAENQIHESETLLFKRRIEPLRLGIRHTLKVVDPDRGVDDNHAGLLRHASQSGRVEITFPRHFTAQAANALLSFGLDQQPQRFLHNRTFRWCPAAAHRLTHQPVIDINVGSHC
jgi:hypothetical protein